MTEENADAIIRMFHVHKRYGSKFALKDLSLDIYKNEYLFVTGRSGAGKTTLLRLLYLGETVSEGQVLVDGLNLSRIARNRIPHLRRKFGRKKLLKVVKRIGAKESRITNDQLHKIAKAIVDLRRKFGIIFQDYKLIPTKTVFENVALVLEVAGRKPALIAKKVKSVLRMVGMEDRMNAYPQSLSGGEQQRVAVARAAAGDPKIILADEPTGSLDEESADVIMNLLDTFHSRGATIIIATHDKELLERGHARVIQLRDGQLWSTDPA
ncbi:MAG: ATP-binding cassette domain-containing protein [Desulfatitalea sp.]|nr:ATP-binding cassette domain-containing protein [Desulfatitalea sp.]